MIGVVILSMSVMRDILRDAYLKLYFHPEQFVVKPSGRSFRCFWPSSLLAWFLWFVSYGAMECFAVQVGEA